MTVRCVFLLVSVKHHHLLIICDIIKGNESDVGNIDFELQAERGDKFFCFTLFGNSENFPYLFNQMSD